MTHVKRERMPLPISNRSTMKKLSIMIGYAFVEVVLECGSARDKLMDREIIANEKRIKLSPSFDRNVH